MKYGYARVSTTDQDASLQIDALQEHGCDEIFVDKISASTTERPELNEMCNQLHSGDTVVVWKLDRMFRSTIHALGQIEQWSEQGILFTCITQGITTADDSATGKLMRTVLLAFAEFERDLIIERTKAGMKAAKCRGVHVGRPRKLGEVQIEDARAKLVAGWNLSKVARFFKVSRATLYRALEK